VRKRKDELDDSLEDGSGFHCSVRVIAKECKSIRSKHKTETMELGKGGRSSRVTSSSKLNKKLTIQGFP
jgi:hypothetical protein